MKYLFILKDRTYNKEYAVSYGLVNSAKQVANYLEEIDNETKLVSVIDGNSIDREVHKYKPDVVIIEALWVSPEKLKELVELKKYKNIKWIVRIHSDISFLSAETMAFNYINKYININSKNLFIAFNNEECYKKLSNIY